VENAREHANRFDLVERPLSRDNLYRLCFRVVLQTHLTNRIESRGYQYIHDSLIQLVLGESFSSRRSYIFHASSLPASANGSRLNHRKFN
jgi:hypothetical protein